MKRTVRSDGGGLGLAVLVALAGLLVLTAVYAGVSRIFRRTVLDWAEGELAARVELAAANLKEPLACGDFGKVRTFAAECKERGVRLTVHTPPGGVLLDTQPEAAGNERFLCHDAASGEYRVRLGLPLDRVLAPCHEASRGFLVAECAGVLSALVFFLVAYRQRVRIRELARLERFRREFIADVSHEFKTPLTGILGAADLLAEADERSRPRLVEMIVREARRLNVLAQEVLDLARLEREGVRTEFEQADAAAMIEEAMAAFAGEAARCGVKLGRLSEPGLACVCDVRLTVQALSNLIANALRHSGSADVTVKAARRGDAVEFSVVDHGIGIPSDLAARVFERFYRVDPSRSRESGGAGLGLSIVRRIARLHGGEVRIEPEFPSGCRFTLTIPSDVGGKGALLRKRDRENDSLRT